MSALMLHRPASSPSALMSLLARTSRFSLRLYCCCKDASSVWVSDSCAFRDCTFSTTSLCRQHLLLDHMWQRAAVRQWPALYIPWEQRDHKMLGAAPLDTAVMRSDAMYRDSIVSWANSTCLGEGKMTSSLTRSHSNSLVMQAFIC